MPYIAPSQLPEFKPCNIHFIIPTKSNEMTETKNKLQSYVTTYLRLVGCGSKTLNWAVGCKSIFEAYESTFKSIIETKKPSKQDIFVFCHDDIEIHTMPDLFISILKKELDKGQTGFVGVAGTRKLTESAVWWDHQVWKEGLHRGFVFHGKELGSTFYGPNGPVVVLDGLFMACSYGTLQDIKLSKPVDYNGDWDFYDIYYSMQAHKKGYINKTVPITISHLSKGELAGRDSWHANRQAFIRSNNLPIQIC